MPRHEIVVDLALSKEQHLQIDMYEMMRTLETLTREYELFRSSLKHGVRLPSEQATFDLIRATIARGDEVSTIVDTILDLRNSIRSDLEDARVVAMDPDQRQRTIMRLFDMLDNRVRQLRARSRVTGGWIDQELFAFRHSFELYFEVMSACGETPYHVQFDDSPASDDTYRMVLDISALDEDTIRVPVRICDITLDLAENARKYSSPGSRIGVSIVEEKDSIRFIVQDEGIGIPEDEIEAVVGYGVRGSNARSAPTGGGLGLTKAYSLIRTWGGRMWIETSGKGTTIEAVIPKP